MHLSTMLLALDLGKVGDKVGGQHGKLWRPYGAVLQMDDTSFLGLWSK